MSKVLVMDLTPSLGYGFQTLEPMTPLGMMLGTVKALPLKKM